MNFLSALARWAYRITAVAVILLAVFLTLMRVLLPFLDGYRSELEARVSEWLGQPVQIEGLATHWRGIGPEFRFSGLTLFDAQGDQVIAKVDELRVGIDLIDSLRYRQFATGLLLVKGAHLSLQREQDGKVLIKGIDLPDTATSDYQSTEVLLNWVLAQDDMVLQDSEIQWCTKQSVCVPITILNLQLNNRPSQHVLTGSALSPTTLPDAPVSRLHFEMEIKGDVRQRETVSSAAYVALENIDVPRWLPERPLHGVRVEEGQASAQLWAQGVQGGWQTIQADFTFDDIVFSDVAGNETAILALLAGNVAWQQQDEGGWEVTADKWYAQRERAYAPAASWRVVHAPTAVPAWSFSANHLGIDGLLPVLLQSEVVGEAPDVVRTLLPRGELTQLHAFYDSTADPAEAFYLYCEFDEVGVMGSGALPSITGLSGGVNWQGDSGTLQIASDRVYFSSPALFEQALPVDDVVVSAAVTYDDGQWWAETNELDLQLAGLTVAGSGVLSKLPDAPAQLALHADFAAQDAAVLTPYLPVAKMSEALVSWLRMAVQQGQVSDGTFVLTGPMQGIPFEQPGGRLEIDFFLSDAALSYWPDWPAVENIEGKVSFDGRSMEADIHSANMFDMDVHSASVYLPEIEKDKPFHLTIEGEASTTFENGIRFVQDTPLADLTGGGRIGDPIGEGEIQANIFIDVPFNSPDTFSLTGEAVFSDANLQFQDWDLDLTHVNGVLGFFERGVNAYGITAELWDRPLSIDIATVLDEEPDPFGRIDIAGRINPEMLVDRWPHLAPIWVHLSGETDIQTHVFLRGAEALQSSEIMVGSDLLDLAVDLPAPYGKTPDMWQPLRVEIPLAAGQMGDINIYYGDHITALLALDISEEEAVLERGRVHLGGGDVSLPLQPGLLVSGQMQQFIWDQWQPVMQRAMAVSEPSDAEGGLARVLRQVSVTADDLQMFNRHWPNTTVHASRGFDRWLLDLSGDRVEGVVQLPDDPDNMSLVLDLEKLHVDKETIETREPEPLRPQDVPAIQLQCDDCRYGDMIIGDVLLKTYHTAYSLQFEKLQIAGPLNLSATGAWINTTSGSFTLLEGDYHIPDVEKALENWGQKASVVEADASGFWQFQWPNDPTRIELETLTGELTMTMDGGRIPDINTGVARLISLLSLQNLKRRLQLDFDDVYKSGFAFDAMDGSFVMGDGKLTTEDVHIEGAIADVDIEGTVDLINQTYDYDIDVTPFVTSTIPIAATLVGGPVVGAAVWAAEWIFRPVLGKAAVMEYRFHGPWDDPQIERTN